MLKVLSSILCDLDPKVKVIGQKAGICDGVPSTSALVFFFFEIGNFFSNWEKSHLNPIGKGAEFRPLRTPKKIPDHPCDGVFLLWVYFSLLLLDVVSIGRKKKS